MATITTKVSGAGSGSQALSGTDTGEAAAVDLLDAAASFPVDNVEAALALLGTPLTLTIDAEGPDVGDVINVTVAGPAHTAQYMAQVFDSNSILGLAAAWTLAEVGAGAPVFGDGTPTLLFTTDAAGAAQIRVTDVATGTNETVLLVVTAVGASGGLAGGHGAAVRCDFDT